MCWWDVKPYLINQSDLELSRGPLDVTAYEGHRLKYRVSKKLHSCTSRSLIDRVEMFSINFVTFACCKLFFCHENVAGIDAF